VIEFAISAKVTGAFKQATLEVKDNAWHKIHKIDKNGISIETNQEFAEVCFVPEFVAAGNKKAKYRYIAIREKMVSQKEINGLEPIQLKLPFPTLDMETVKYKLFGIVTNTSMAGNELINWHRERCGDSEKVHSIEKNDFAGGQFPSKLFGANAAWWVIMMLSFNLNVLMTKLACPEKFKSKRMKNIRFYIIAVAGRFVKHARTLALKLSGGENTYNLFISIRENISGLINAP
jgi:hypothetical protein